MSGRVIRALVGTAVFVLVIGAPKPLDVAVGLVVCVTAQALADAHLRAERAAPPGPALPRRLLAVPGLVWFTFKDVVRGTVEVARVSLRPSQLREPGFVEVELGSDADVSVVTTALLVTLSPGSFVVDISPEQRTMLVHVLDTDDPEALRRRVRELYERHQAKVLP